MKKEYIQPLTKIVLVRLNGSVLDGPNLGRPSQAFGGGEVDAKTGLFEEDDSNEGWDAQTNVWSSYE
jgi:hypothetical protein